jgi:hypothetical protein
MQAIDAFTGAHAMALTKKKRRTLLGLTDAAFATYKLGVIVANCCKDMDLPRAFETYLECKRDGVKPNAATFANLLSLTAGFGDQGMSLAPPRTVEPPQDINAATVVFEDMKACGFAAQESVYTAMVRCCCTNQRAAEGLKVYRDMQGLDLVPKLRTLRCDSCVPVASTRLLVNPVADLPATPLTSSRITATTYTQTARCWRHFPRWATATCASLCSTTWCTDTHW